MRDGIRGDSQRKSRGTGGAAPSREGGRGRGEQPRTPAAPRVPAGTQRALGEERKPAGTAAPKGAAAMGRGAKASPEGAKRRGGAGAHPEGGRGSPATPPCPPSVASGERGGGDYASKPKGKPKGEHPAWCTPSVARGAGL